MFSVGDVVGLRQYPNTELVAGTDGVAYRFTIGLWRPEHGMWTFRENPHAAHHESLFFHWEDGLVPGDTIPTAAIRARKAGKNLLAYACVKMDLPEYIEGLIGTQLSGYRGPVAWQLKVLREIASRPQGGPGVGPGPL